MASYFFQGNEVIDGVSKKRVFEVAGVSSLEAARKEIEKFHPNATDVVQVQAESKGEQSTEQPRIIGPVTGGAAPGEQLTGGRQGTVAPNATEQPANAKPDATVPTDPGLRK